MEIYAKIQTIRDNDFNPKTAIIYKNDADIFVYSIIDFSAEMIQDIKAHTTNIVIDDEFLLSLINDYSIIHLLTIEQAKFFLKSPMDKQSTSFFNSFLRKDKIKKILEHYG